MTIFYKNITKLCEEKGISINGMCKLAGFSNAAATQWKNGAKPSPATINKVTSFFGISKEELLQEQISQQQKNNELSCIQDKPNTYDFPMDRFSNKIYGNIIALCKKQEITIYQLMNILKIPNKRMYDIKEHGIILLDNLLQIAIFFNVKAEEITKGNFFLELKDILDFPNKPSEKEIIADKYDKAEPWIQKSVKKLLDIE